MGREERNRQNIISDARETVAEHRERIMGPVVEHGKFGESCPKCGANRSREGGLWSDQFCPGKVATLPEEVEQPCGAFGEHLHTSCLGCGWTFRQACADGERLIEA